MTKLKLFLLFSILYVSSGLLLSCKKQSSLSDQEPVMTVTDLNGPSAGSILLAPFNSADPQAGFLYVLDQNGKIISLKKTNHNALDFKKWDLNGVIRYTYNEYNPGGFHIPGIGYSPGDEVILDENMNEIKRVDFLPFNGRPEDQTLLDSHDFILLNDNHYIAECYYQKKVTNIPSSLNPAPGGVEVVAPIIQEVNNGQVIWEWDATSFPELYLSSTNGNNFSDSTAINDYAHMNSMIIDPKDSNLIISFRVLNEIIKVNRKNGSIMWRLGGASSDFVLSDDQKTIWQHDATLTDSGQTLLVFDNGEAGVRPVTRIVEYKLDEENKKLVSFKSMDMPNNVFTVAMGSVQKRGNTYFIGGGTGNYVMEVDNSTGKILFQMKLNYPTYRAFKY